MNNSRIKQLYREVILKHDREPVNFEKWEDAPIIIEAHNPICGDRFTLYLDISDGIVQKASFHGYGCAISKAATSMLVARINGKPIVDILALCDQYKPLLDPKAPEPEGIDAELAAFMSARIFPARLKCASLSWEELERYLRDVGC